MVGLHPRIRIGAAAVALLALALAGAPEARAQLGPPVALGPAQPVEARVWLDRGDEPILQRGDRLRIYYRSVLDAYIAIFQIDTDGTTRLVFPLSPNQDHYARGGRDYRVVFPGNAFWSVADQPGVGYFFIVASPEPFDFSEFRFSPYRRSWDLSYVGQQVYRDPYVAMDDYVAALVPDWQRASYALDFTAYHVGERYEYPRFLCYDCHGYRQYASWNPYYEACSTFRVVIYDDPYFYPARRYRSDRVVWTQPVAAGRPRFAFRARVGGEPAGPLIQARVTPPPTGVLAPAPRRSPASGAGGVAPGAPSADQRPTNLGVIRGRPSAPAPSSGGVRSGNPVTAPSRSGGRPTGVVAPSPRDPAEAAPQGGAQPDSEPTRVTPATPDERLRPVLRKRPSEDTGTRPDPAAPERGTAPPPAPAAPERRNQPAEQERPAATPRSPAAAPATPAERPAPSAPPRESENPPARPQNGGAVGPRTSPSSGGGSPPPVVRRTPDGRPVVRR